MLIESDGDTLIFNILIWGGQNKMRPEFDGVKFYSVHDWGIGEQLAKAAVILESFDENKEYTDINKVIELYNIQELIDSGVTLNEWDEGKIAYYKKYAIHSIKF